MSTSGVYFEKVRNIQFRCVMCGCMCITAYGTGLLWGYGLLRRGYILLCHTKVINRHVTESEDMLLLFRQLYNAYP